jgi:molybdenum cofactor synthesis domain-containing protein
VIAFEEAQAFVLDTLAVLTPDTLTLEDALGCVMAEELMARESVPGFINSSMDGFALRASDTVSGSVRLRVIGSVLAGDATSPRIAAGEAMRIMTGAPLPEGADCVCMIEEAIVEPADDTVRIERTFAPGEFLRHPGEDIEIGQVLFSPGQELGAPGVGVLASQGFSSVLVHRRPRVGVLSTGNELSRSQGSLRGGEIRDTNRPLLLALLHESGFEPVDLGIVRDDLGDITQRLRNGVRDCDAVISTGGVSVGDVDHVKLVIGELGGESARWMQVAIRPGKPFAYGVVGEERTPVFGLPGNPVSTRVSFELFVRPALRLLAGHHQLTRPQFDVVLDDDLPRVPDGKLHLIHAVARVHGDGRVHVVRTIRHGSHLLSAIVEANAILMLSDGVGLSAGDVVRAMILDVDRLCAAS